MRLACTGHCSAAWHQNSIISTVFALLTDGNIILDILEQSSFQKYTTWWVFSGNLSYAVFVCLCVCVFVYLYFCICAFDTWEYHFWHPWTILFSKIYHMVGLSGTLSYAVFVYLCLCICVFVFGLGRSLLDQFGKKMPVRFLQLFDLSDQNWDMC